MKVALSDRAKLRLRQIHDYIANEDTRAALKVASRIRQVIDLLGDFPELGRKWDDGSTRAMIVSGLSYRVHYEIDVEADTLTIITIVHTSQKWPKL